ncbi:MAG TPA: amino acid transporter [Lentisphaeria bacterium]|nr:MAG: hypothetical protein A2X47_01925 [Lentisphaerae bacterium GWF2_38_69]HBM16806.1 amino acid transporter [Lentisphaeria bacterium]
MAQSRKIGAIGLVMINLIAIDSLRNIPLTAPAGLAVIALYAVAVIIFFIPCAIAVCELTGKWPVMGGLSIWVGEAFGPNASFFVVWLQWIYNLTWFPSITAFAATHLAYGWTFTTHQNIISLTDSPAFITTLCIILFWGATLINCFGMRSASILSGIGTVAGTLIPMILIILLGFSWIASGNPLHIASTSFSYDHGSIMGLFVVVLFSLMGLEISSAHAGDVNEPKKNYPRALWLTVLIVPLSLILSNMAIGMVIPPSQIDPRAGLIESFAIFFSKFHISWMSDIIAFSLFIGAFGAIGTWSFGLSRYLNKISERGYLPKRFAENNKNNVPKNALVLQGIIVTILSFLYIWMPNVDTAYWYLSCLTAQLALIAYVIFFIAAIKLRLTHKWDKKTEYVFGPTYLSVFFYTLGIIGSLLGLFAGFLLPGTDISLVTFNIMLGSGLLIICIIPLIVIHLKKQKNKLQSLKN